MNTETPPSESRSVGWVVAYATPDEWEARLIRTALINAHIQCRLQYRRLPSGQSEYTLVVQGPDQPEAQDLVDHVLNVLISQPEPTDPIQPEDIPETIEPAHVTEVPRASPTAYESVTIATREGIGEIVHHIGHGFELRVGPRPHYIVEESRWEEFTDFSAQRQEFSILLRAEYANLFQWIKENKMMAEFIRLVESTYRDVPPPRLRRTTKSKPLPVNPFAMSSVVIAVLAVFSVFMVLPWFISLVLGMIALACGLVGRYQIGLNKEKQRGTFLAMLGVGIACVVIAMALVTRQSIQPSPQSYSPNPSVISIG